MKLEKKVAEIWNSLLQMSVDTSSTVHFISVVFGNKVRALINISPKLMALNATGVNEPSCLREERLQFSVLVSELNVN